MRGYKGRDERASLYPLLPCHPQTLHTCTPSHNATCYVGLSFKFKAAAGGLTCQRAFPNSLSISWLISQTLSRHVSLYVIPVTRPDPRPHASPALPVSASYVLQIVGCCHHKSAFCTSVGERRAAAAAQSGV